METIPFHSAKTRFLALSGGCEHGPPPPMTLGRHRSVLGLADVVIAATATAYKLVVLTDNVKHVSPLGVGVVDPLERLPD